MRCATLPTTPDHVPNSSHAYQWTYPGFVDTLPFCEGRSPRCPRRDHRTHRSSGGGPSSWSGRAPRPEKSPDRSSPPPRRFGIGCGRPIAMPAAGRTGPRLTSGKSCAACRGKHAAPRGARNATKSRSLVCAGSRLDPVQGFEFVQAHKAEHRVATTCRVLGVSPAGTTPGAAGRCRVAVGSLSGRARADVRMGAQVEAIHAHSPGTYMARRGCTRNPGRGRPDRPQARVVRLMRAAGLKRVRRRTWVTPTQPDPAE
jgi:hypothetical protein